MTYSSPSSVIIRHARSPCSCGYHQKESSSSTAKPARTMPLPKTGRPGARGWSSFMPHPASATTYSSPSSPPLGHPRKHPSFVCPVHADDPVYTAGQTGTAPGAVKRNGRSDRRRAGHRTASRPPRARSAPCIRCRAACRPTGPWSPGYTASAPLWQPVCAPSACAVSQRAGWRTRASSVVIECGCSGPPNAAHQD